MALARSMMYMTGDHKSACTNILEYAYSGAKWNWGILACNEIHISPEELQNRANICGID